MPLGPPKSRSERHAHSSLLLPNHLQSELNVSRLGCQVVHKSIGCWRTVLVKDPCAVKRLRRKKVGVVQNVEDLRSELNVESLRNSSDRVVLSRGKVQVYKFWTDNGIAAGIAQQIRAINDRACGRKRRGSREIAALD